MDKNEILRAVFDAFERNDLAEAGRHLTDDFTFIGPVPEPIGKDAFVALQGALLRAIPDWKFNRTAITTQGDTVVMTVHITGTHSRLLEPLLPGMPPVQPTGKRIELPDEAATITFRGDKITVFEAEKVAGGGVMGILAQIGVPLPPSSDTM